MGSRKRHVGPVEGISGARNRDTGPQSSFLEQKMARRLRSGLLRSKKSRPGTVGELLEAENGAFSPERTENEGVTPVAPKRNDDTPVVKGTGIYAAASNSRRAIRQEIHEGGC